MAILSESHSEIYVFDPHARNCDGMPDSNGTEVVCKFIDISILECFLLTITNDLMSENFETEQFSGSFSIECHKTETKVITLANHKGRRAIHSPIKTREAIT